MGSKRVTGAEDQKRAAEVVNPVLKKSKRKFQQGRDFRLLNASREKKYDKNNLMYLCIDRGLWKKLPGLFGKDAALGLCLASSKLRNKVKS